MHSWQDARQHRAFVRLVAKLRESQREYFATKDWPALRQARALEGRLDMVLRDYDLYDESDPPPADPPDELVWDAPNIAFDAAAETDRALHEPAPYPDGGWPPDWCDPRHPIHEVIEREYERLHAAQTD